MSSESRMSFSLSEDRGVMEHLNGMRCLGVSVSLAQYIDSQTTNGGTYRVKFGVHLISGSISLPFALVMSKTVRMEAILSQRESIAKNLPGHILNGVTGSKRRTSRLGERTFARIQNWGSVSRVSDRLYRPSRISPDGMYRGLDSTLHLSIVP